MSRKIIQNIIIQYSAYKFLLACHINYGLPCTISELLRDVG